ncbi:hypothetical protein [Streptomyces sp. NPDC059816]|uniref:hypothetical protein n=1 Tax=Streptomyces sp. NPDC059816 TaxID=3346960 RepID=UPI0036460D24
MHLLTVSGPELAEGDVRLLVEVTERLLAGRARSGARGRVVWLIGPGLGGSPAPGPVLDALAAARAAAGPVGVVVDGHLGGGPAGIARITALTSPVRDLHTPPRPDPTSLHSLVLLRAMGPWPMTPLLSPTGRVDVAALCAAVREHREHGEQQGTLHPDVWQHLSDSNVPALALPAAYGGSQSAVPHIL